MTGGLTNFGTIQNYSAEPYVSIASFRAAPTWLDTDDLIVGGTSSKQDAELLNVLLRATSWADLYTGGGTEYPYLGASTMVQNFRTRANRWGQLSLHPSKSPVQEVTAILASSDPLNLVALPNIAQIWIEDNRQIIVPVPGFGLFTGLQFGGGYSPQGPVFCELQYVAGYFNSTLAAGTYGQGTNSLTLNNALGLIPGTVFRVNDPGFEEVCTVASNYTTGSATVPLVNPLMFSHTSSSMTTPGSLVGVSALPMAVQQAVICYAVGLLLREDVAGEEPFADTNMGPSAKTSAGGGTAAGLIYDAEEQLQSFRRVR